jgi:hypothetical protein
MSPQAERAGIGTLSEKSRHSVGWYGGAAVFWLLTAWLITVGLSSIIPQIFTPAVHGASNDSCAAELRTLERELLERTSQSMANAPVAGEREALTEWLLGWDRRLEATRASCNKGEQTSWTELSRLRHGMRSLVDRFDQEQAARIRQIEKTLGPAPGAEAP